MGRVFQVCDSTEFEGRDQVKVTTVTATGDVHLTDSQVLNARGVEVSGQMTVDNLDIVDGWESLTLSGAASSLTFTPASLFNIDATVIEGTMTSSEAMAEGNNDVIKTCMFLTIYDSHSTKINSLPSFQASLNTVATLWRLTEEPSTLHTAAQTNAHLTQQPPAPSPSSPCPTT